MAIKVKKKHRCDTRSKCSLPLGVPQSETNRTLVVPVPGEAGKDGEDGRDGIDGTDGTNGTNGVDGSTPYVGPNGNWWIDGEDTGDPSVVQPPESTPSNVGFIIV